MLSSELCTGMLVGFGFALSLSGDTLAVGARYEDGCGTSVVNSGSGQDTANSCLNALFNNYVNYRFGWGPKQAQLEPHDVALQHWMPVGCEMVVDAKERQWQRQHDEE